MRSLVHLLIIGAVLPVPGARSSRQGQGGPRPAAHSAERKMVRSAAEEQLFESLNLEREKAGLSRLDWDEHVARAARQHARLLAANHELSHRFPDEAALPERLAAAGARFTISAENVAVAVTGDEAHMALMASPGHRANIMSTRYNAAGIGVAESSGHLYVTQDFAKTTPVYTEAEFREAFIAALNRERALRKMAAIDARADAELHAEACSTKGDAHAAALPSFNVTEVVTFTLSDPDKLPEQLIKYAQDQQLRRVSVGVCFRPDAKYGYANFWVVAAFGG